MASTQNRRTSGKLRIEHHKITIHYLSTRTSTDLTASQLVAPGTLRRYRTARGRFTLSWRVLLSMLTTSCNFDPAKHVFVFSGGASYTAKPISNEKSLNEAFREQIDWFKESHGGRGIVFWALRKNDLEVSWKDIDRRLFLEEASSDVGDEDPSVVSTALQERVDGWSEKVPAEEGIVVEKGVIVLD